MHIQTKFFFMLLLGAALGGAVTAPVARDAALQGDTPPRGAWAPCFGNPVADDSQMVRMFQKWDEMVQHEHGIDMGDAIADGGIDVVPEGTYKGLWIVPGCVAIEGFGGDVTFWRYRGEGSPASWQPHPLMEAQRAKDAEKAAFEAEIDAKVAEIEAYMEAHDGAMPPVGP